STVGEGRQYAATSASRPQAGWAQWHCGQREAQEVSAWRKEDRELGVVGESLQGHARAERIEGIDGHPQQLGPERHKQRHLPGKAWRRWSGAGLHGQRSRSFFRRRSLCMAREEVARQPARLRKIEVHQARNSRICGFHRTIAALLDVLLLWPAIVYEQGPLALDRQTHPS